MQRPSVSHQQVLAAEGAVYDTRYHHHFHRREETTTESRASIAPPRAIAAAAATTNMTDFRLQPRNPNLSLQRTTTGSAVGSFARASRGRKRSSGSLQQPSQSTFALTDDPQDVTEEEQEETNPKARHRAPVRMVSFVPRRAPASTSEQIQNTALRFDSSIVSPSNTPAQKTRNQLKPLRASTAPAPAPPHMSSPGSNLNGALRGLALHSPHPSPSFQQFSHQDKSSPFSVSGKPTHQPCSPHNRGHGHTLHQSSSPKLCSPPGLTLKTNATPPPQLKTAPLRLVTHTPAGDASLEAGARKKKRPQADIQDKNGHNNRVDNKEFNGVNPKLTKSPKLSMVAPSNPESVTSPPPRRTTAATSAESWLDSSPSPPVRMMLDNVPPQLSSTTLTPSGGGWSGSHAAAAFSSPSSFTRTPTTRLAPRSSDGSRQSLGILASRPSLSRRNRDREVANSEAPAIGLPDDLEDNNSKEGQQEVQDSRMLSACKGETPLTQSDVSFIPLPDWGNDDSNSSPTSPRRSMTNGVSNSGNLRNAAIGVSLLHPPSNRNNPDPIDQMMLALDSSSANQGDVLDSESLSHDDEDSSGFLLVAPRDVEEQATLRPSKRRSSARLLNDNDEKKTSEPQPQGEQKTEECEISDSLSSLPQLPRSASSGAVASRDLVTPPAMKQGSSPPPLLPSSNFQFH